MINDVYELNPSMRILLCMHNMSAVNAGSAKKTEELTGPCGFSYGDVENALRELHNFGYVVQTDHTFYLSSLGISVVRSVYT